MRNKFLLICISFLVALNVLFLCCSFVTPPKTARLLPLRYTVSDPVPEGEAAIIELQVANTLDSAVQISDFKASCGCISVETTDSRPLSGLIVPASSTVPLRITLGTAGRYGSLSHAITIGWASLDDRKRIRFDTTLIELRIQAGLRISPSHFAIDEKTEMKRCIVYSGIPTISLVDLEVESNQIEGVSAEIVECSDLESQMTLEDLLPVATLEVRCLSGQIMQNRVEISIRSRDGKFSSQLIAERSQQRTKKIWPSKLFVSRIDSGDRVLRSVEVLSTERDEIAVHKAPSFISYRIKERKAASSIVEFEIDLAEAKLRNDDTFEFTLTVGQDVHDMSLSFKYR